MLPLLQRSRILKARERVQARKRKNKQKGPEEGKAGVQDEFRLRIAFDAIGQELNSLMALPSKRLASRI